MTGMAVVEGLSPCPAAARYAPVETDKYAQTPFNKDSVPCLLSNVSVGQCFLLEGAFDDQFVSRGLAQSHLHTLLSLPSPEASHW